MNSTLTFHSSNQERHAVSHSGVTPADAVIVCNLPCLVEFSLRHKFYLKHLDMFLNCSSAANIEIDKYVEFYFTLFIIIVTNYN